ncbi:MAG: hypothetical protein KAU31_09645, partial [Spirochaetaceae bacterium]|nr:hypothetical protein [Spirochaetaceae bacterium]
MIATYLVSQSIFVFGSIYFKKSAFLKTVLVAVLLFVIYTVFFTVVLRLAYWNVFAQIIPTDAEINAVIAAVTPYGVRVAMTLRRVLEWVGWVAVPIFFWLVGYVRLRETEV